MIEVKNLNKTYKNFDSSHQALTDINITFGNKGMVFLSGRSGAGKSTAVNILAGLDVYDSGQVLYNGKDILTMSQKERDIYRSKEIALIFERSNLLEGLTVEENIKVSMELSGTKVDVEEINKVLKVVKLDGFNNRKIHELSSGEAQRVTIAKVLISKPKVILADEPTANLDDNNAKIFWNALKRYSSKALVIGVVHDKDIINAYADRVIEIDDGKVVKDVSTKAYKKEEEASLAKVPAKKEAVEEEKRTNLSFKSCSKLGFKFLTKSKFKFISMCIIVAFTLTMFAISYLMTAFNSSYAIAKTTIDQGLTYVVFASKDNKEIDPKTREGIYSNTVDNEFYRLYTTNLKLKYNDNTFTTIKGIMEVSATENAKENRIGQKILFGNYPLVTNGENKIAISDYLAKMLIRNCAKYSTAEGSGYLAVTSSEQDLLGKYFEIEDNSYEVCAIYETNYKKYVESDLKIKEDCLSDFNFYNETVYSVIHVAQSKTNQLMSQMENAKNVQLELVKTQSASAKTFEISSESFAKTKYGSDFANNVNCYKSGELASNDIIIPVEAFKDIYGENSVSYNLSFSDFTEITTNKNGAEIYLETPSGYREKYTIVGLSKNNEIILPTLANSNNTGDFVTVLQHSLFPINNLVCPIKDKTTFANQVDFLLDNNLVYTGKNADELLEATQAVNILKVVFVVSTIFLIIFSMYLMYNFFQDVARLNKRSVGALRTMGANSLNLMGIFAISCLILSAIGVVGGFVFGSIGSAIMNAVISSSYSLSLSLININFGMFGYTLLLGILITAMGAAIPVSVYSARTPVEIIKK